MIGSKLEVLEKLTVSCHYLMTSQKGTVVWVWVWVWVWGYVSVGVGVGVSLGKRFESLSNSSHKIF